MSILRSCYSSFHSEGASFRGSKVARIFPSDMKGDDGLYSQKSDFESVGLYRAEWSGASKGFRFLNTPACFLFQSLQPSCQWRRKLLFFSFFFSSLSENTKFRRRIVNFFSSFILLSPCEIIIYPSRFLFIRIFCIISCLVIFLPCFHNELQRKKKKKKEKRANDRKLLLRLSIFQYPERKPIL